MKIFRSLLFAACAVFSPFAAQAGFFSGGLKDHGHTLPGDGGIVSDAPLLGATTGYFDYLYGKTSTSTIHFGAAVSSATVGELIAPGVLNQVFSSSGTEGQSDDPVVLSSVTVGVGDIYVFFTAKNSSIYGVGPCPERLLTTTNIFWLSVDGSTVTPLYRSIIANDTPSCVLMGEVSGSYHFTSTTTHVLEFWQSAGFSTDWSFVVQGFQIVGSTTPSVGPVGPQGPAGTDGSSVYPATTTASFPFGVSASSVTIGDGDHAYPFSVSGNSFFMGSTFFRGYTEVINGEFYVDDGAIVIGTATTAGNVLTATADGYGHWAAPSGYMPKLSTQTISLVESGTQLSTVTFSTQGIESLWISGGHPQWIIPPASYSTFGIDTILNIRAIGTDNTVTLYAEYDDTGEVFLSSTSFGESESSLSARVVAERMPHLEAFRVALAGSDPAVVVSSPILLFQTDGSAIPCVVDQTEAIALGEESGDKFKRSSLTGVCAVVGVVP